MDHSKKNYEDAHFARYLVLRPNFQPKLNELGQQFQNSEELQDVDASAGSGHIEQRFVTW